MGDILLDLLFIVAETILEAFLEIVGEAVIALISRSIGEVFVDSRGIHPILATIGYVFLGLVSGILSVFFFPHPLVHQSRIHGISVVISPIVTGLVMSQVGSALRRQGQKAVQIESFGYGFAFALGMALVRFVFVK